MVARKKTLERGQVPFSKRHAALPGASLKKEVLTLYL
jgi:hypothetical protein